MGTSVPIISNNLNVVMKVLTTLTIVVSLPTLVASFYGMNVSLPGENHPLAFLVIFAFSIALTSTAAFIFYKPDWLQYPDKMIMLGKIPCTRTIASPIKIDLDGTSAT
jgi:magnesium transporter